jgi:hypothetical protein
MPFHRTWPAASPASCCHATLTHQVLTKVTTKSTYGNPRFPKGSQARIADRATLEEFMKTWEYHHKLRPEQVAYADRIATVVEVGWYHGGDPVYKLDGIIGLWLDECLSEPSR